jgi:hypothetical protein
MYLAVRYAECQTRPVRVMPAGCGCDEAECEYSRIRDSFALKVLTELPSTYNPMPDTGVESAVYCTDQADYRRHCPPCPDDPWVILAAIALNANGELGEESIDCVAYRRYVVSFAETYVRCGPQRDRDRISTIERAPGRGNITYEVANIAMVEMINDSGLNVLERNFSGDLSHAVELDATEIRGVSANSILGRAVAEMTIGEIAAVSLDEFVNTITTRGELSENEIDNITRRAPEIHRRALRIANVAENVRGSG